MEWLLASVERDLGIDRKQLAIGEGCQVIAYVPTKWLASLKERRVLPSVCSVPDGVTAVEIETYLQRSVHKLPAGWTRVTIQALRKKLLQYQLSRRRTSPPSRTGGSGGDGSDLDSFCSFMQYVADQNYKNLWRKALEKSVHVQSGGVEQQGVSSLEAIKQSLSKALGCCFVQISGDGSSPKETCPSPAAEPVHPNLLRAEALLESADTLYVVQPFANYSLRDIVTYSPAKLANSNTKVLFIIFQVLQAMRTCHREGLACGSLSLHHVMVDERLCTQLRVNLSDYERPEALESIRTDSGERTDEIRERSPDSERSVELRKLVTDWVHGRISNFQYLMGLNRLSGRRVGDPNYHPVLPWVVDFTIPYGKFRDLRKSKFRLNKGDKQLDFTYEMTRQAFAAGGQAGEHLHVPHHISDVLSDITYYVYKARRTPRSVLCSHVRSQWEPNEYPASMERMQAWTPDECIPEFYTDPTIFQSIHPDMPDLDIPSWSSSYQEFINVHRKLLESKEVSVHLHHWVDLTFGYKLTGKDAVKAKNVCLHLVDNHTNLTSFGVVQLFDQPHPQRLMIGSYAPPEAPSINKPFREMVTAQRFQRWVVHPINGTIPEMAGSEGQWPVDKSKSVPGEHIAAAAVDDDLEQGTEALDSLSGSGKALEQSSPSQSSNLFPLDSRAPLPRANRRNKATPDTHELEESKIILPEAFHPLQALEELEKLSNFLVRGLYRELVETKQGEQPHYLTLDQLFQRDMQAFGILIAEIFFAPRLRALDPDASLLDRFLAMRKFCLYHMKEIAAPLQHAVEMLLQLHKSPDELLQTRLEANQVNLFEYEPVFEGLPPPCPAQLLSPNCPIIPFPPYFSSLHQFICTHQLHTTDNGEQGRDFVFHLWQQLDQLLGEIRPEGLEILLPFILGLMSNESTAVYAAWYLFEPIAKALGPRNTNRYLQKPLIGVYEKAGYLHGRFYLYIDCFIIQLIVRLGLQPFLNHLLPHILQILTGFDGADEEGKALVGNGEDDEAGSVSPASSSYANDMKSTGEHSSASLIDYSSGISFNEQAFPTENEDFQNGIYLDDQMTLRDQESVSVGKLSDKSSASELSLEDRLTDADSKERVSLRSVDSNQDLKQSEGSPLPADEYAEEEGGGEEEEESCSNLDVAESTVFNSLPAPDPGEAVLLEDEEEQELIEEPEGKEQKILLDTACKMVKWLSAKLGPTVTSRYIVRNLLRLLTTCYFGPEKHQFVSMGENGRSHIGNIYEKREVIGDLVAKPVLDCLMYVAHLYGEPVLTYQCLTYIAYLVAPNSSWRLNSRKEAGLLSAVVLTQKIIVYLSDTTLMDVLPKINQDVLLPVLDVLTSCDTSFPSGAQARSVLCIKTLSLIALVCLRIGQEMVQQHMSDTLRSFFGGFSVLRDLKEQMGTRSENSHDSILSELRAPDASDQACDITALEELEKVFSLEMAYSAYIPFYCLIGDSIIRKVIKNHDYVWKLTTLYQDAVRLQSPTSPDPLSPEHDWENGFSFSPFDGRLRDDGVTGTFGSALVGNRIEIPPDSTSESLRSAQVRQRLSNLSFGGPQEDGALKQDLPKSLRTLCGNWLAYWQYEIGLSQQDSHFYFHQIKLQSFVGHSGTVKCLSTLSGEDFFLSASKDKTVRLWPLYNFGDGTCEVDPRLTYSEHKKSVFYVHQMETLQEVVSCDGAVHMWDQYTGKPIRIFDVFDSRNPITAVTTMPAPHVSVIAGTADSILRFIDPRKPGLQHEFKLNTSLTAGLIRCMAVNPSGRSVAIGFSSGYVYLLDTRTGLIMKVWQAHEGDILQLKAAENNVIISSSTNHSLSVWKEFDQKPFHQYKSPSDPVHTFDLYNNEIVAGTVANKIGIYSLLDTSAHVGMNKLSSENFRGTLTTLAVLPTKRLLLLGSDNGIIRLLA
ncbi:WD repeat-containing protein 81 [Callorhinchus milii]|uniref:WD repeat-containing protein 81 n=1 Tax=Callorhinchus milii TaxID=7868 RepID=UPI001C3FE59D|nr:WD repeat-containing protein 81 [Callorhinchus milii]